MLNIWNIMNLDPYFIYCMKIILGMQLKYENKKS